MDLNPTESGLKVNGLLRRAFQLSLYDLNVVEKDIIIITGLLTKHLYQFFLFFSLFKWYILSLGYYRNDPKFSDRYAWATEQTQIRLLLEEQSDQGLHCLPFRLHRLDSLLYGRAT